MKQSHKKYVEWKKQLPNILSSQWNPGFYFYLTASDRQLKLIDAQIGLLKFGLGISALQVPLFRIEVAMCGEQGEPIQKDITELQKKIVEAHRLLEPAPSEPIPNEEYGHSA